MKNIMLVNVFMELFLFIFLCVQLMDRFSQNIDSELGIFFCYTHGRFYSEHLGEKKKLVFV